LTIKLAPLTQECRFSFALPPPASSAPDLNFPACARKQRPPYLRPPAFANDPRRCY
jgi:hypothetical protein